ncbi:hypothetical protein LOTGIDRAFT_160932 [Lottia gigantea]|uniref:Uncharacterized protein n=1 Tax=Lottia gigantea TaxID=225164 RepID=V4ANG7_LOTGI|nr:hypothetical protein LOTGIDRAFT_160932 [Lottia gigantea]ESO95166.1 hypothetical protein LOTGIDRAFT_160932 [Lottia gigantea]
MEAESQPVSTPNRHQLPLIADVRPTPKRKRTLSPSGLSTSQEPLSISKKPHTDRRTLPLPTFTATPSTPMTTPRSNPETPKPQRTTTRGRLSLTTSPHLQPVNIHVYRSGKKICRFALKNLEIG